MEEHKNYVSQYIIMFTTGWTPFLLLIIDLAHFLQLYLQQTFQYSLRIRKLPYKKRWFRCEGTAVY